jgi:thiamine transport system ATP-binding protein
MLQLADLRFRYPGGAIDYDFSMVAMPGEITAVEGASGSGKSTLLDLIAGFLQPSSGVCIFGGVDLLSEPPERRSVSVQFQGEIVFEHLTAAQNIALGLPPKTPLQEKNARVRKALAEVGLPEVAKQRASTLSGGQKQRVALARTLLRNRPILLLDEPFSALDDATRQATRELVRRLTVAQNWTTILVSHYREDVEALASRSYRLAEGRLTQEKGGI